jgi:hypothetical protein
MFNFKSHIGRASASGCNKQKVNKKQMSNARILIAIVLAIPAVQNEGSWSEVDILSDCGRMVCDTI